MHSPELRRLGGILRAGGLTERAVGLLFGVVSPVHAPRRALSRPSPVTPPPAALLPWLFVGGADVFHANLERLLGSADTETLKSAGLLERHGNRVHAPCLLLPLGGSLVACDRPDAGSVHPDDSTLHLLGCLPPRRVERWLDAGTGSAIAPLARRGMAHVTRASDTDRHALDLAALGAALSGAEDLDLREASLLEAAKRERFDLVTFNAPLPEEGGLELTCRLWDQAARTLAPDGELLVHSAVADSNRPFPRASGGELVVAIYTPPGAATAFGITRWRPDGPERRELRRIELDRSRPHLRRADLGGETGGSPSSHLAGS